MARQVLPIVGAVVGAYFGNPGAGYAIGAAIGNAVDPLVVNGPKIGDTAVQTSAEGAYRSIIYGTAAVAGNLIWTGPKIIRKHEDQASKGGGPVTVTERLFQSFAIRICEGPVSGILRIWEDEKLVYDVRTGSTIPEDTAQFATRFTLHLGDEDQLPDAEIEGVEGIGNAPAYRGSCYAVFPKYDLTDRRGSIPQYRFEVVAKGADITWVPKAAAINGYYTGTFESLTRHDTDVFTGVNATWYKTMAMSPDGLLVAAAYYASPTLRVFKYDRDSDSFSAFPISGAMPTGTTFTVAFSPDGNWLAVGSSGAHPLTLYKVTDTEIQFYSYPDVDPPTVHEIKWQPGQLSLAISCNSFEPVWLFTYFPTTGAFRFVSKCVTLPGGSGTGRRIDFRPDGGLIAYVDGIQMWVINATENPMTLIHRQIMPGGVSGSSGVVWSAYLDFMYVFSGNAPAIGIMRFMQIGDDDYTLVGYPAPTPTLGNVQDAQASYDKTYIVLAESSGSNGGVEVYKTDGISVLTLVETVPGAPVVRIAVQEGSSSGQGDAVPGTLSEIVSDICIRCSVPDSKYDVSELTDSVDGFVLSGSYSGISAINALRAPFFFDISEYDKKVWFPKRGKPVVATITYDDLVDEPADPVRQDGVELPAKLHLEYQNSITGYETAKATSSRSSTDVRVTGETSVSVPVVLDSTAAQQAVVKLHKVTWTDLEGEIDLSVSDKYIQLVAADNIGLSLRGHVYRLRIERVQYTFGSLRLSCKVDRQSAYSAVVTGVPIPNPTPPPTSIVGATILEVLDIPALIDTNDLANPVEYVAMSGVSDGWYGATFQRSINGGSSFATQADTTTGTVMGTILEPVESASEFYTDNTNRVVVSLANSSDVIEDISEQSFLSEGGAFALKKDDGTWELMQYRDVEEDSDGNFILTRLLRGRLNSGPAAHSIGARFVLLDAVQVINVTSGLIGQTVIDRAVSHGTSPDSAATQSHTVTAQSQREWPVAYLQAARDGANVVASWTPRHRFGTEVNPIASINFQGYRVTLTDGSSIVTFDTTTPGFTYDVSAFTGAITVTVAALNRITGPGPSRSEIVP